MYLPLYDVSENKYYFRIPVAKLCIFTVSLPLFAFIICVMLTMLKDFEHANNTHCKVPNIFPSISAAIGNYEPQTSIWKFAIYIHAPLRMLIIKLRWDYYKSTIRKDLILLVKLGIVLNVIENLALLGLTYWTSSLNYPHHEVCFKTFISASIFYMLFTCIMLSKYRRRDNLTIKDKYSLKFKWRALFVNAGSFAFAAFFFLRHNKLCEPYVYSMFGLAEYIVVISNIAFHLTTVYDLNVQNLFISKHGLEVA